jgi:hypothetical protein
MSDTRQLPESYIQTFREAVQAVDHMRQGGPETTVAHEGRPVRIGYIIEIASQYRDWMPDDLYAQLCEVAVSGGEAPDGDTFADGAKCLRSLYNDIMKQRRTKAEAQAAVGCGYARILQSPESNRAAASFGKPRPDWRPARPGRSNPEARG